MLHRWPIQFITLAALVFLGPACSDPDKLVARAVEAELQKDPFHKVHCPPGEALPIVGARLRVSDVDTAIPVREHDRAAIFRAHLDAGRARLETFFIDENGIARGAYYVYARRLSAG